MANYFLEKERILNAYTNYVEELLAKTPKDKIIELANMRKMPIDAMQEAKIFYIDNAKDMILNEYKEYYTYFGIYDGNGKIIFKDKSWIIPIMNSKGQVQNLVGYNPNTKERYFYGTSKYYERRNTLYGLENIDIAYKEGIGFITEGIMDCIRLRSLGIKNSFANCGTFKSEIGITMLNRCKYGVIKIPDRDEPGTKAKKVWKFNKSITILVPPIYKDVDEYVKEEEEKELLKTIVCAKNWLKKNMVLSQSCFDKEFPIFSPKMLEKIKL